MLNIPEEQIYTLYDHENLKEELTFKDVLFNIVYDIKQYLGISISFNKLKEIINLDSLDKYIIYLKDSLNPYTNNLEVILNNTKELYKCYKNKYVNNIPNQITTGHFHSKLLDDFVSSLLEIEYISIEYHSFN